MPVHSFYHSDAVKEGTGWLTKTAIVQVGFRIGYHYLYGCRFKDNAYYGHIID